MVAGVLSLIVMLMLSTSVYDESAWKLPRMAAAVLTYSLALATLVKDMPEAAAPWIGMTFGLGLYFGNLYGFTQLFPWFTQLRTLDTLAAHVLFGIIAATAYRHLAAPPER